MNSTLIAKRVAIAGVWLHQGLWCKVLGNDPRHERIVADAPGIGSHAVAATRTIGLLEAALAVWVAAGRHARSAAVVQSLAVVTMNVAGLRWGRDEIARPAALIARNAVFLALIWVAPPGHHHR